MCRGKCVRPASGQSDHREVGDSEPVREHLEVRDESQDVVVEVRRGSTRSRARDGHQPDPQLLRGDPGLLRDLASSAGSAVQPDQRTAVRVAVLGEGQQSPVRQPDGSLQARRGQHASSAVRMCAACTQRRKRSTPRITYAPRIEWKTSKPCCVPGSSAYATTSLLLARSSSTRARASPTGASESFVPWITKNGGAVSRTCRSAV